MKEKELRDALKALVLFCERTGVADEDPPEYLQALNVLDMGQPPRLRALYTRIDGVETITKEVEK